MGAKKPKHYVNNKDFFAALVEYRKSYLEALKEGHQLPQISNYIGLCIDMICRRLSFKYNFIGYSYNDEMVSDAIENCFAAIDNFNPDISSNAFAYFTSIAWHAFIRRIEKETTQNYTKHKNLENLFVMSDEFYSEVNMSPAGHGDGKTTGDNEGLQRHYDVIRNFEEKQARKKEKSRQTALIKLQSADTSLSKNDPNRKVKT